jgi:hypothetical protein
LNCPFLVIDLLRKRSKLEELGESPMFQLNKADIEVSKANKRTGFR